MATEMRSVAVVPLSTSNYATWKVQCRMAFIKYGLCGIVDVTEEAPVSMCQLTNLPSLKQERIVYWPS